MFDSLVHFFFLCVYLHGFKDFFIVFLFNLIAAIELDILTHFVYIKTVYL